MEMKIIETKYQFIFQSEDDSDVEEKILDGLIEILTKKQV
jgi:hypothetical protein